MTVYGYHASHDQVAPRELLTAVERAEQAGFEAAMCSDHLTPWSERQAHSGFAWSWLGAALEATSLTYGVVNAPGQRYHPVIIAQAIATLEQMNPGRFWVALGSGQAINEHVTGDRWPDKPARKARLRESVDVRGGVHPGADQLGGHPWRGPRRCTRPVAHEHLPVAAELGSAHRGALLPGRGTRE